MVTIYTTSFNIQQFYVLLTHCIYVFCMHLVTSGSKELVFITEKDCVYCAVRIESLYITVVNTQLSGLKFTKINRLDLKIKIINVPNYVL